MGLRTILSTGSPLEASQFHYVDQAVAACETMLASVLDRRSLPYYGCVIVCVEGNTMATNLSIDPKLLDKALKVGGEKTKKATVNRALQEFIARREQKRLLELFGKLDWDHEFDYKHGRTRG